MVSMRSLGAAVLVTAIIGMRVSRHYWQAYEPLDKFFAVFVLLALVTFPYLATWRETKSGKKTELVEVYLLILMVALLFR
jgi:DNA-binding Lrp family transcriptional regulator